MTSKFVRILVAAVFGLSLTAWAQIAPAGAASSPAAVPNAPSSASAASAAQPGTGTKVGTINIEAAIFSCNEGRRDGDALSKKLEPKKTELENAGAEIEGLKKQLTTQGDKMNEDAAATLRKQIESKQKVYERSVQDARDEFQGQQGEIFQRVFQKMAPVIAKYAGDNNYGLLIDTSQQWPQGPVIMAGPSFDITQQVIDAYNIKSGVAAPPPSPTGAAAPKPATKPATTPATKPATTPAAKPATTNPPKQ